MTDEQFEENASRVIAVARRGFCKAAEKLEAGGVRPEDVAIALAYAAQEVAARFRGNDHGGIEWLRTMLDLQERQLMDRANG